MRYLFQKTFIFSMSLLLTGCGVISSDNYYQNDGPPSNLHSPIHTKPTHIPQVEPFYPPSLRPYTVMGKTYTPMTQDLPYKKEGVASWYGKQFHGNKTAIGEIYDMHALSAAHKTMPLPSYARVTNLENGKSIIVRVNDRGPFLHNREIDLSYAAAIALDYVQKGTARVRVERLTFARIQGSQNINNNTSNIWQVQVGAFDNKVNALSFIAHVEAILSSNQIPAKVYLDEKNGRYRILVSRGTTEQEARALSAVLHEILGVSSFITKK